ncbi:MAG: thioredoxin family protein [Pedobacter sp.]|nr:thioredoxin family protein [Pedobacter sp.]
MIDYQSIFKTKGINYENYRKLIDEKLGQGFTTGDDDTEFMLHYTKLNVQRINRLDKTVKLSEDLLKALSDLKGKYHLLVITEGWCGDAAQILPVVYKMVSAAPDKFDLRFVLRDKNEELVNAHLTNGGKAIPILLFLNEAENKVLASWAPRPKILQALLADWKKESTDLVVIAEKLHGWYAKDKTVEIQKEFTEVLEGLD